MYCVGYIYCSLEGFKTMQWSAHSFPFKMGIKFYLFILQAEEWACEYRVKH